MLLLSFTLVQGSEAGRLLYNLYDGLAISYVIIFSMYWKVWPKCEGCGLKIVKISQRSELEFM